MKWRPKLSLEFLKDNKQLVFSIVVIVLVPALIVVNTYFIVTAMQKNMDQELRNKAVMTSQGLNVSLYDDLSSKEKIQNKIKEYGKITQNVKKISVVEKNDEDFKVVASLDEKEIGQTIRNEADKNFYVLAWFGSDAIATLRSSQGYERIGEKEINASERFWSVTQTLKDKNGKKTYLANVWVSLSDIDTLTASTILNATIILIVTIGAVILLIISNGRLFEYSILFSKLKEVDQMKDDFISIASHELRTPLTGIKGYLEMILDDMSKKQLSEKERRRLIEGAMISSERLDQLVADVLDVSRIEQGRIKIELAKVNIKDAVKKVVSSFDLEADKKGLKIKEVYPKENLFSDLDGERFEQVMVNLVGNAIKYTNKGEVEVTVSSEGDSNKISVRDSGIGMDEEERKKLFTKFYRVQNDATKDIIGTGLGLWITKEIIEKMNGKILVDSIKDVGSEFTIVFPKSK